MENRKAGYLIIIIAVLIGFIIYSYNTALLDIISSSCSHGSSCPMYGTLNLQTNISLSILIFIIAIGIYLIIFGKERLPQKPEKEDEFTLERFRKTLDRMDISERRVFEKIIEEKGSMMQSSLIKHTGFSKVRITRILDRLEKKNLIERKRRGMTNIVTLKR